MKKVSTRTLVLGTHEPEARQIYELAKRLVRGEGPPAELRMPSPSVTVVPCGEARPRDAWGVGGVGVAIEMQRPYPPIEALVVAGYILFGLDWPTRFKTLRLPAALATAYRALEQYFDGPSVSPPAGLVTIPKRSSQPLARQPLTPALTEQRTTTALPPPSRLQLTHKPGDSDANTDGDEQ